VILDGQRPPWHVVDPIRTLRARPDEVITLRRRWPATKRWVDKAALARTTVKWLARRVAAGGTTRPAARRIASVRALSIAAIDASRQPESTPPLFPTDIAIKQNLFDRIARMHKFTDFPELARQVGRPRGGDRAEAALEATIVADILFSTPSRQQSTYELAHQCGLFVRPRFEHPCDVANLTSLPPGIAARDIVRARLIAPTTATGTPLQCCDWNRILKRDGTYFELPNPWSESPARPHTGR
jgi:hypothetical protein